jgi:hypothetical protein
VIKFKGFEQLRNIKCKFENNSEDFEEELGQIKWY